MTNNVLFSEVSSSLSFVVKKKQRIDLLNLHQANAHINVDIHLIDQADLILNFGILNSDVFNKSINLNVYFDNSNVKAEMYVNCLGLNDSQTNLKVKGIVSKDILSGYLKIQINGIIDGNNTNIKVVPIFEFMTNSVQAHHSVLLGNINPHELFYLQSRGIEERIAKHMLISSKIFACLSNLDKIKQNHYESEILNIWGGKYA